MHIILIKAAVAQHSHRAQQHTRRLTQPTRNMSPPSLRPSPAALRLPLLLLAVVCGVFPPSAAAQCESAALQRCPAVIHQNATAQTDYDCASFLAFEACAKDAGCAACEHCAGGEGEGKEGGGREREGGREKRERGEREREVRTILPFVALFLFLLFPPSFSVPQRGRPSALSTRLKRYCAWEE